MTQRLSISVVATVLLARAVCAPPTAGANEMEVTATEALRKGITHLMEAQGTDGAWHSKTYGAMRPGAALTALVLYALGHAPDALQHPYRDRLQSGIDFLQLGIRKTGCVANPDGSLDYPTYGSAMMLVAIRKLRIDVPPETIQRLSDYLVVAQLTQQRNFTMDSPHFGGWDLLGPGDASGLTPGTNTSISCYVLEALAGAEHRDAAKTFQFARQWAAGCQNMPGDGGFVFTPDRSSRNNKAQWTDPGRQAARSYGTATSDGVRCLLYSGVGPGDLRIIAALRWIVQHERVGHVPGLDGSAGQIGWREGLRFYYFASLAKTVALLPSDVAQRRSTALLRQLVRLQRDNGSWQNGSNRMREDDPIIATSLAVVALGELLSRRATAVHDR